MEGSALATVARHEQALLEKLADADLQAAQIVAQARRDADSAIEERERALAAEAASLRAKAAQEREHVRSGILKEAETKGHHVRAAALHKAEGAVDELVALVLPKTGNAS